MLSEAPIRRLRQPLLLVGLVAVTSRCTCDPGWFYDVTNSSGREDCLVLADDGAVCIIAGASVFTTSLWVDWSIRNRGGLDLEVWLDRASLVDAGGVFRGHLPQVRECAGAMVGRVVRLRTAEECSFSYALTLSDTNPTPELERLRLTPGRVVRGGREIPVTIDFQVHAQKRQ